MSTCNIDFQINKISTIVIVYPHALMTMYTGMSGNWLPEAGESSKDPFQCIQGFRWVKTYLYTIHSFQKSRRKEEKDFVPKCHLSWLLTGHSNRWPQLLTSLTFQLYWSINKKYLTELDKNRMLFQCHLNPYFQQNIIDFYHDKLNLRSWVTKVTSYLLVKT